MRNFLRKIPIVLILCLTYLLMVFVGFGEARRTYNTYRIETTVLQSDTFLDIIDPFIQAGFPLTMYSGYDSISKVFIDSNEDIDSFFVYNADNEIIFENRRREGEISGDFSEAKLKISYNENVFLYDSEDMYLVERLLPEGRDGRSGKVAFYLSKNVSREYILSSYTNVFYVLSGGSLLLIIAFYVATSSRKERSEKRRRVRETILKTIYLAIFIIIGGIVTLSTIQIYNAGVRGKADAIGTLLARRLNPVSELGINFEDLEGVDTILSEFNERYDIVNSVSLITSKEGAGEDSIGYILYDSNPNQIGQMFKPDLNRFLVFDAPLYDTGLGDEQDWLLIKISVPRKEINRAIFSSLINFSALLIGSGLIAMIFLSVGLAFAASIAREKETENIQNQKMLTSGESLQLIKAAYFLVVFISAMAVPFLPLLVAELNNGAISSLPFTVYYLTFALVLIPSGNLAASGKIKETMAIGFIAELAGALLVAFSKSLPLLTVGRALCGIGQGFFLIGFQSYVLSVTPKEKRTQGAAIKVIARNSALIAGTAIGALLYVFMGKRDLFILSAGISLLGFIYLLLMVPKTEKSESIGEKKLKVKNIFSVFKDGGFLKVLLLTGIPAKMGITGVVNFAVPLLLGTLGYTPETIGQLLMLFFIVSMLTTKIASKRVDKTGNTSFSLFLSSVIGGIGMAIIGFQEIILGTQLLPVAIGGLLMIGVANGLISAPIITQITKTKSSEKVGYSPMIAVYTFLERFGHILGPGLLSYLIVLGQNQTAIGIGFFGAITITLGLLYVLITRKKDFITVQQIIKAKFSSYKYSNSDLFDKKPERIVALSFQLAPISLKTISKDSDDYLHRYKNTLHYLHSAITSKDGVLTESSSGNILAQWDNVDIDRICNVCEEAFTISNESMNFSDLGILEISGIGIYLYDSLLTTIPSVGSEIEINPKFSFCSYLASLNSNYTTNILVSSEIKDAIEGRYETRLIDVVQQPARKGYDTIFELCGSSKYPVSNDKEEFIRIYEMGFKLYMKKRFAEARKCIGYLLKNNPNDKSVKQLYHRILLALHSPDMIPEKWSGIL